MTKQQINKLIAYVEKKMEYTKDGKKWKCDNTHKWTIKWLKRNIIDQTRSLRQVKNLGGCCCDCEVVFNVKV